MHRQPGGFLDHPSINGICYMAVFKKGGMAGPHYFIGLFQPMGPLGIGQKDTIFPLFSYFNAVRIYGNGYSSCEIMAEQEAREIDRDHLFTSGPRHIYLLVSAVNRLSYPA